MMHRFRLIAATVAPMILGACYGSHAEEEGDSGVDTAADRSGDVPSDPGTEADAPADTPGEAETDADAVADVGPDGTITCPPAAPDGSWMSFTIDGGAWEALDIHTPCVLDSVVGEEVGHIVLTLVCGTGGLMETHSIDILSNPPVYADFWVGQDVMFRYIADPIWWVNRHFTLHDMWGNLLIAGADADRIAPAGWDPSEWYAPLGIRVLSGVCPPEPESCGPLERQALEVTLYSATGVVFDGYTATIGPMISVSVWLPRASRYLEMRCDDVPDQFYSAFFVLYPEG